MQKIFKIELENKKGEQIVKLPFAARLMTVLSEIDKVCLYFIVNGENELEERLFEIYVTGDEVPHARLKDYLGSYSVKNYGYLTPPYHIFENTSKMYYKPQRSKTELVNIDELAVKFFREISGEYEVSKEAFEVQAEDFAKARKCVDIAIEYAVNMIRNHEENTSKI